MPAFVQVAIDDLRRLTVHASLRVEAIRRRQMPTGYTVALQPLAITAFDSNLDAALIGLTLRTRDAIAEVLDDDHSPAGQRNLALRLRAEDVAGTLASALAAAMVLVNDEYDTSPSEPNLGAHEDV